MGRRSVKHAAVAMLIAGSALSACARTEGNVKTPTFDASGALAPPIDDSAVQSPAGGAPWPAASHDARHTGTSPHAGPTTGHIRWVRQLEGDATPGPAVGIDGSIYAASNAGILHALDPADGTDRWTFDGGGRYGSDLSTTSALLRNGTILWPGPEQSLFALDADGRLLWKERLASSALSPAVSPDESRVYVMDTSGTLTALGLRPGANRPEVQWKIDLGDTSYGSPAIGPDGSVATTVDRDIVSVAPEGKVRWRITTDGLVETSPAVTAEGTVVVGTNDRYEYGVSPSGKVRWRFPRASYSYSSAIATPSGLAFFGDHKGFVTAVDGDTGTIRSRVVGLGRTPTRRSVGVWTAPVVDRDHHIYFGTRPGHIYGFAFDGTRLFDVDAGSTVDSYPALTADGALVVGAASGKLFAIAD